MSSPREKAQAIRLRKLIGFDLQEAEGIPGRVAGIDEAGRGPLAGPVVASAVILERPEELIGLDDSKKISACQREKLFFKIARSALIGIGVVEEKVIDEINIYEATRVAMKKAVMALSCTPAFLLIDGSLKLDLPVGQKSIINGDQKSASIAAASIIAKVFRDRLMCKLHDLYPAYAFHNHKGYGTAEHIEILRAIGPSPAHRRSFAPVRECERRVPNGVLS